MVAQTDTQAELPADHDVRFYHHVHDLTAAVADRLGQALRAGAVCVVVATEDHRAAFEAQLAATGVDIPSAVQEGVWATHDAAELARFLTADGHLHADRFDTSLGAVIREAASAGRPVAVYGEIVGLLWDAGQLAAAIELEQLWNRLGSHVPFSLLCGYRAAPLHQDAEAEALEAVCHLHSHVAFGASDGPPLDVRAHRRFPRTLDAPRRARRFIVDVLRRSGRTHVCDDAGMVVAELATNAVRHARSQFSVTVSVRDHAVRIAVADLSPVTPALQPQELFNTGGRGLELVATLARRWGAVKHGDGKIVWAELPS